MKQVFIADTHFGHDKFHSDNWEYKFWKKYNSINTDFILYHLGDLSFVHNHEYLEEIFKKFRANEHCKNIVLILGNHDDKASRYLQHGIIACNGMTIFYKNKGILLTHEPQSMNTNSLNIHGHLHTKIDSHRDYYPFLSKNNILVEAKKIYFIEDLMREIEQC